MTEGGRLDIRPAGVFDAAAIARLLHDFNSEYDDYTPGPAALAERIARLLQHDEMTVLLAGDPPQGLAVLRFRAALWKAALDCYLEELYVVPDRRGRGLGRALMEAAIELARARNTGYMHLGTGEDDVAARALYERLGFSNDGGHRGGPVDYCYELEL